VDKKILLVGTVSNVAKTIEKELKIVLNALSVFEHVEVYLVESDSNDSTLNKLDGISKAYSNVQYVSLKKLKLKYSNRIERLRYCRNHYIKYIRSNFSLKKWDFIIVADLDGMNLNLNKKSISSCFCDGPQWDGVMANQKNGYYDLLALRADGWMDGDCFELLEIAKKQAVPFKPKQNKFLNFLHAFAYYDALRNKVLYSKMHRFNRNHEWIKVKSAFGGFAIYKVDWFLSENYDHLGIHGETAIDHVDFNLKCVRRGAQFFINPKLINSNWNAYNINKLKAIRFLKELKKTLTKYQY
jgi:hypothetical protein